MVLPHKVDILGSHAGLSNRKQSLINRDRSILNLSLKASNRSVCLSVIKDSRWSESLYHDQSHHSLIPPLRAAAPHIYELAPRQAEVNYNHTWENHLPSLFQTPFLTLSTVHMLIHPHVGQYLTLFDGTNVLTFH